MGFFSDIGHFISQNVQSAVSDVTHIVQQVTPIAVGALGLVVPGVGNLTTALTGGVKNPTSSVPDGTSEAINQLNANQQALVQQNAQLNALITANGAQKSTWQKITENVKQYWYLWLIPFVGIPIALWMYFKPKKTKYNRRR